MASLSYQEVTADSLVSPVPSSQAEIDNELVALADRMRALRTHRNVLSPISSIPPEILGAVFVHLARQVQSRYSPDAPEALSWLSVGHVCRHWRDVALANPHLWATPFLNSTKGTEEMLLRSKMAPLILRSGRRYRIECVQKAFEHVERLQEVTLDCSNHLTPHIVGLLGKLSSCSTPNLKSLSLDGGLGRRPRIAIPTSFAAPSLRRLQLNHCDLSWASPVLTGLTVLDIKTMSAECLPTLDGLISVLRRMPTLQTLCLESALPTLPLGTKSLPQAPRAANVRLPHLEQLRLVGKMLEVVNVLARVELPSSPRLEVQLSCHVFPSGRSGQEWNSSLPIISRALESCFKSTSDKSRNIVRSMRLSANDHLRLQYGTVRHPTSWVEMMPQTPMEWTSECPVTLDFSLPGEASRSMLKKLWKLVHLGRLETLYLEGCLHPCWDGFWTDVLGHTARNLTYIHLQGTTQLLEDLFKSMRSQNPKHTVSRSVENRSRRGPTFCPALSHLVFEHLEFSAFCTRPSDLYDVLIDRVNDNRGLDKLTITGCTGISAREVQFLREVVVDVEWDEYESPDDYDFDYDYDSFDDEDDDEDTHYSFYSGGVHYSGGMIVF
ncbi:hypothetical protein M405DRAFT_807554 [Rhizopogon salebrosus TDB-379]|nr:hypothetical protein M405DRAFT_807554 [Rhizopogon salebrosus TDB-379]